MTRHIASVNGRLLRIAPGPAIDINDVVVGNAGGHGWVTNLDEDRGEITLQKFGEPWMRVARPMTFKLLREEPIPPANAPDES